jgi:hypothetical protein
VWPVEDNVNPSDDAGGINVPLPDNIQYSVEYNPATGQYEVVQSVGGKFDYRPRTSMTLEEYMESQQSENISSYWKEIQEEEDEANREYSKVIKIGSEGFENIFGSNEIEIRPQIQRRIVYFHNFFSGNPAGNLLRQKPDSVRISFLKNIGEGRSTDSKTILPNRPAVIMVRQSGR